MSSRMHLELLEKSTLGHLNFASLYSLHKVTEPSPSGKPAM